MPSPSATERMRLQPADSFDRIGLIARSQSDSRNAVAEFVESSLDEGPCTIRRIWRESESGARSSTARAKAPCDIDAPRT